jgi:hypothetical protein
LLYEFSFTPDVFEPTALYEDDKRSLIVVELLRGMCDNGMVANLDKDQWMPHVRKLLDDLPASHVDRRSPKDKLLACFEMLANRHRLVRHPRRMAGHPRDDREWLALALDSHERVRFHGIVLTRDLQFSSGQKLPELVTVDDVLDSTAWTCRQRSLSVERTPADYRRVLGPVLRHAKALLLVDPYLNPLRAKFWATVELAAELIGQRGHGQQAAARIHLHAGNPEHERDKPQSVPDRLAAWETELRGLKLGHRFVVCLWEQRPGGPPFHDRYILTDQCGISAMGETRTRGQAPRAARTLCRSRLGDPRRYAAGGRDGADRDRCKSKACQWRRLPLRGMSDWQAQVRFGHRVSSERRQTHRLGPGRHDCFRGSHSERHDGGDMGVFLR